MFFFFFQHGAPRDLLSFPTRRSSDLFADIGMGIGLIIAGLASVILGQAVFGSRVIIISTLAVALGSVLYRVTIQIALQVGLDPNDMKLVSAVLVVIALVLPTWGAFRRIGALRSLRRTAATSTTGGD